MYHVNYSLKYTMLRYANVYGLRQNPETGVAIFTGRMLDDEPVVVIGDGEQTRAFV